MVGLLAAVAMLLATAAVPRAAIASLPATADGWVLADLPQPGGEPALVRSVTAGPSGFVAVGETCGKGPACQAAAWSSRDGIEWTVAELDRRERKAGRALDSSATDVTWGPRGYVAAGWYRPATDDGRLEPGEARGGPEPVAALWRSTDGLDWRRATRDAPFEARTIEATSEGYVLLAAGRPRAAISPDGRDWTSVSPANLGGGTLWRLVPVDDGLAAIGDEVVIDAQGKRRCCWPAVWRSADLEHWFPQTVAGKERLLGRIAALGDRVVVVEGSGVFDEDHVPRDSLTRVVTGTGDGVDIGVVPGAHGLYAIGTAGDRFVVAGQACRPALWASADGLDWWRVPWAGTPPGGAARWHDVEIAADGERVVVAGTVAIPWPDKPRRRPRLRSFAMSAPLEVLQPAVADRPDPCPTSGSMPLARLTAADGSTVESLPVEGCWCGCQDATACACVPGSRSPAVLPALRTPDVQTTLELTLAEGARFTAASVAAHRQQADLYAADWLAQSDPCTSQDALAFDVGRGHHVIHAWVTFECGQGSAVYQFRVRHQPRE